LNYLKKYKFSELYEMSSGISSKPEQAGHGAPFCSFTTVFNNYFLPPELPDRMDTSVEEQETYSLKEGDVLLTRTSETLDELGMSSVAAKDYPSATFSGFLKRLRPTQADVVYHKFLAFYLRSPLFRKAMNNNAVMTLRCSLNEQIFSYLDVLLPDFDQQKKIGDLLFQIYTKIELNNRINEELEGMAKLLYDYWFVQFDFPMTAAQAAALGKPHLTGHPYRASGGNMIYNETLKREIPEGWRHATIGETFKTHLGGTPSRQNDQYWTPGEVNWLSSGENPSTFVLAPDEKISKMGLLNSPAKLLPAGAVVLSIVRHLRASILGIDAATNQSVVGILETHAFKHCFIYPYIVREIPRLMVLRTGAQQPHINKGVLDESLLVIPDDSTLEAYTNLAASLFLKMKNYHQQNQELTQLRDWLLPMLMNGQVTVG